MAGITVIAPLWITIWVLRWLFSTAESFSDPLIRKFAWGLSWLFRSAEGFPAPWIRKFASSLADPDFHIPGLAFVLTFLILWLVGLIATNVVGRRLIRVGREALARTPLVRTIYAPIQRLLENMLSSEKGGFKKAVLVEYPRKGIWTLGFVAGVVPWQNDKEEPANSVFVPTAPNPTTGFMLIVPQGEMRHAALTVEEAFQMIVSAGVAVPGKLEVPDDQQTATITKPEEAST